MRLFLTLSTVPLILNEVFLCYIFSQFTLMLARQQLQLLLQLTTVIINAFTLPYSNLKKIKIRQITR